MAIALVSVKARFVCRIVAANGKPEMKFDQAAGGIVPV